MEKNIPTYLNEKEVSKITRLALSTLRNARFKGVGISYYKLGKAVRYRLSDVLNYLEERKIELR